MPMLTNNHKNKKKEMNKTADKSLPFDEPS